MGTCVESEYRRCNKRNNAMEPNEKEEGEEDLKQRGSRKYKKTQEELKLEILKMKPGL